MNAVTVIGRMLLALVVVLGIMWCLARWARKPMGGRADGVLAVLARQQLSRSASVAVLRVMDRALVLGVTEQGIRLIAETDLTQVQDVLQAPDAARLPGAAKLTSVAKRLGPDRKAITASPAAAGKAVEVNAPMAKPARDVAGAPGGSKLDGSVLSPKVWRQLVTAARDLTVRR